MKRPSELDDSTVVDVARARALAASSRDAASAAGPAPDANGGPAAAGAKAAAGPRQPEVKIDTEIHAMNLPLSVEEEAVLEQSLLREGGPREALIVWRGPGVLIDGHHRHAICVRHGLPYSIREIDFADRAAAIDWIERNQDGRRNTTPEGLSYRRGRRYLDERQGHGGNRRGAKPSGHIDRLKTDERLAAHYMVAPKTIRRDAEFAEAVDLLASRCGAEVRRFILTRRVKLSRQVVLRLWRLRVADQRMAVEHLMMTGKLSVSPVKKQARSLRLPADPDELAWSLVHMWDKAQLEAFRQALARHTRKPKKADLGPLWGLFG